MIAGYGGNDDDDDDNVPALAAAAPATEPPFPEAAAAERMGRTSLNRTPRFASHPVRATCRHASSASRLSGRSVAAAVAASTVRWGAAERSW